MANISEPHHVNNASNNTAALIFGGIIVLALIFGFVVWNNRTNQMDTMEPSSGVARTTVPDTMRSAPNESYDSDPYADPTQVQNNTNDPNRTYTVPAE